MELSESQMPWFTTKGQIVQTVLAFVAVGFAGYKAFPDMRANDFFSIGAILFYLLVGLVLVSVWIVLRGGSSLTRETQVRPLWGWGSIVLMALVFGEFGFGLGYVVRSSEIPVHVLLASGIARGEYAATVDTAPLRRYAGSHDIYLLMRAANPKIDDLEDTALIKSRNFSISGDEIRIGMTMSDIITSQFTPPSGTITVFLVTLPKSHGSTSISKVGDVTRLGGEIVEKQTVVNIPVSRNTDALRNTLQEFMAKYPLGYVLFDISYTNQITNLFTASPTQGIFGYDLDWNNVKFLENSAVRYVIRLPDIQPKDGTLVLQNTTSQWPRQMRLPGWNIPSEKLRTNIEVLSIDQRGITFLLGFTKRIH